MKEKNESYLVNYTIERHFLNQRKIRDIIEESILSKKNTEGVLTDSNIKIYNDTISM